MESEPDRAPQPDSPAVLVLRQPASIGDRLSSWFVLTICIALPIFILFALRDVSLRCERVGPGVEATCVVHYDYRVLRTTISVVADEVRLARVEHRTGERSGTPYCVVVVPRRAGSELDIVSRSEASACEADVGAVQGFFAGPGAASLLLAHEGSLAWGYLLLVVPVWLLALYGGLLHFETRRVVADREAGQLVVIERVIERAFMARTAHTIAVADIRGISTGSWLRERTLVAAMHVGPRVDLWKSSGRRGTEVAADRLAAHLGVARLA